ncbi:serine/threonine-protein kinase [Streptomyces sp. NBC_00820]|uniref:serine/threonine-protein kinase n=1 Tax=Streptomyces sp. NBC_00820 TaxID=2975842 RepID=UPI002ED12AF8|nr:serine/threonine-protein kinase [Streptomyces sp. NBC_00820]
MGENRLLQGRYRLLDLIGRGGMGEVWRARDESLARQVAVKCLKPPGPQHDPSGTRVLRERFRREARVAAGLTHRGVTVVHDFGESGEVPYLVMELLEGRDLSRLMEDNNGHPLPVDDVVDIAAQVAAALAYTHRQGVIHRDLKPGNIVRLTDGTVKICDFGIARLGHDLGRTARLTGTGIAMGTPHYMSPEQIGAAEVDRRSDLYSLGCVLYEIATGAPPFDLEDAWAVLLAHRDTPPRPPRDRRPGLPARIERIILDLLAKRPEERPHDADELVRRLAGGRTASESGHGSGPGPGYVPTVVTAPVPVGAPGTREARLPSWSRSMTTGHKAVGTGLCATPPDAGAALTGSWTAPTVSPASPGSPVPSASLVPSASPASPTRPGAAGAAGAGVAELAAVAVRSQPSSAEAAVLTARHREGLALARHGRWAEAGEVHQAVAAARAALLGPDHPDTLASRREAALSLSRTGRSADALRAYTEIAAAGARVLGPDDPDTLAARQETAYVLGRLGRHAEAHQVYTSVLAARLRVMGPDHPDTLRCRHNLAVSLSRLGRPGESRRIALEVAAARARVLGPEHADTLVTRYEVAYALGQSGRWEEALHTYREVAEARARTLGADHPDTLAARHETGICLGRLGRGEDALRVYRDLVVDRTRVQGPQHPETLRARHGTGVNLGRLGRWEEALAEARDVRALRERALGTGHPDTLVSRREIAVALSWLGRWADALTEHRRVAAARERILGPGHPDTLASRHDEAHCLEQLGHGAEAAELYRRVAVLRRRPDSGGC